jgi:hypothetical protein
MFNYEKHPLNAWVYGSSCLIMLTLPMLYFVGCFISSFENEVTSLYSTGDFFENYLSVMLFPKETSLYWLFQIPYLGIFLAIASFVLHLHVYSTIIERFSVLFRRKGLGRAVQDEGSQDNR